LQLVQNPL